MGSDILDWITLQAAKARNTTAALLILFVTCVCVALIPTASSNSPELPAPAAVENAFLSGFPTVPMTLGMDLALPLNARPVYPYSIVPGGVSSPRELKSAIASDPVVASHYSGFDLAKARVIQLKKDLAAFVSYRKGDHVYWTSHKLVIRAGESVITDGAHSARTRCGNRISEIAVKPVNSKDPTIAELETPEPDARAFPEDSPLDPWIVLNPVGPILARPESNNGGYFPPVVPFFFGGGSPSQPTQHRPPASLVPPGPPLIPPPPDTPPPPAGQPPPFTPPTMVPEPGSMLLLATGISATLALGRKLKLPKK